MKKTLFTTTVAACLCMAAPGFVLAPHAQAQTTNSVPVAQPQLAALAGNVRPEARAANDMGTVAGDVQLNHMLLLLQRPAAREAALKSRIASMYKPGSPDFHKWLTARELGQEYGPDQADIATVVGWLKDSGFQVNSVAPSGMTIDFSGTAGQVKSALHATLHNLSVQGKQHIANMQTPEVPAAIAKLVVGVSSLNNFRPKPSITAITAAHIDPMSKAVNSAATEAGAKPGFTVNAGYQLVVPNDLHTIYNFNSAYAKGITGKGQTVVVIEDTNLYSINDWTVFRKTFGLSRYKKGTFTQIHPGGCTDPGVNGDANEATLDAEYASAAAPNAAIVLASCKDTKTTFGGLLALNALINQPVPPSIISISYGECEAALGAAGNATYNYAYQQAASEGVSVFVSSGDEGAASCDANQPAAQYGIAVSGFASTPYNVSVGGTDFGDTYAGTNAQYWNVKNNSIYGSAKSYIPEIPWNDSCASTLITNTEGYNVPYGKNGFCNSALGEAYFLTTGSGSGGPSGCAYGETSPGAGTPGVSGSCSGYAKPNYQVGLTPNDGVRDIPDVSLFAANGVWGHYYAFCYSNPATGQYGAPCVGNPANWSGAGGTSFAAPIVAGIQALVDQSTGQPEGNPNYVYYALAAQQNAARQNSCISTLGTGTSYKCVFHDVAEGDMDVNCVGKNSCYKPSGANGVLSTTSKAYSKAYNSKIGWDYATGIGSLNVSNLIADWGQAFQ